MEIFAGIDGTCSGEWIDRPGHRATNSHVYSFYLGTNTRGGAKRYFEGPDGLGLEVSSIASSVTSFIRGELASRPHARVSLVGHSRGGFIAMLVAKSLTGLREVHFLGLYDAVDRAPAMSSPIENVLWAYHAVRDPARGSHDLLFGSPLERPYVPFGNTGRCARAGVRYTEQTFWASHGAIGGDPDPGTGWRESIDRTQGPATHAWIKEMARRHGLDVT